MPWPTAGCAGRSSSPISCRTRAAAQALDVADSVSYLPQDVTVRAGELSECADAALVVVAIGEARRPGQTRLDMLGRSVEMLKDLTAQLRPLALTCPVVSITNPADIVADYLRKQLSLPRTQCFSTGHPAGHRPGSSGPSPRPPGRIGAA